MNISTPVASEIASVDFAPLTTEEIKRISVKQIVNPLTFEPSEPGRVPIPIVGGLYDPALGAWESLRQRCATCNLDYKHCPGHVGHIALPIPIYNPLFFPQLLRLLRATCLYCFQFRLTKAEVDRFACKLRLIQYGLVAEADAIDEMTFSPKKKQALGAEDGPGEDIEVASGDEDGDIDAFIARRRRFVEKQIRHKSKGYTMDAAKIAAVADARRAVMKQFIAALKGSPKCHQCKAHTPAMRADGFAKIFEMALPMKLRTANAQLGHKRSQTIIDRKTKKSKVHVDEGIAEDVEMDDVAEEEDEEEEEEEEEVQVEMTGEKLGGRLMSNLEVHTVLARLFAKEQDAVRVLFAPRTLSQAKKEPVTADMFFLHAIAVPPTKFRPPQAAGGELTENTVNKALTKILQHCIVIRDHKSRSEGQSAAESMNRLMRVFVDLQQDVNAFLDSSKGPIQGMAALGVEEGIKQKLEKKEGLFRKHMMGKRVNFAARSVISPDPNIETNEIGVPLVFATKLTYPEPVTDENFTRLAEYVRNGPDKWPGAVSIEMENGHVQKLPDDKEFNSAKRREEFAKLLQTPDPLLGDSKPKKVYRHLMENDYVLMNRQPTLHKPSMMAHKARVLKKERTIRMHYANCNTYNADFDGDEMNMHLPQNAIAQAEAREIARTDLQYLVGTSGKPLRGLIQDHLVMGVYLTNRDTFFTREEYNQLMYSCLLPEQNGSAEVRGSSRIITVPPAFFKPQALWTGKQLITTILENIKPMHFDGLTLTSKSKVPGNRWYEGCEEESVIFHKGYFACGIMDKNQLGPSEFGFIHSVYEIYGPTTAGRLLSIMGRLLTKLLHLRAHTCGMDDLLLTPEGNARRRKTLNGSKQVGRELSVEYVGLEEGNFQEQELHIRMEEILRDSGKHQTLDLKANASTKNFTSQVIRECLPDGLVKAFPKNNFQAMTVSGAKGSDVNASQISCLLGQQVLEGRRVPVMVSGKTLPCFKPYETDVRAGGYVTDRFLTGIRPQEFYFHCMAGREGLIDTAVKTSRSGYLQRCLIKGMEGIQVQYDNTVRDSDGSLVQFLYGEDGLDVTKQRYLNQFKFCAQNSKSLLRRVVEDEVNADLGPTLGKVAETLNFDEGVSNKVKKALKKFTKSGELDASDVTLNEYNPARYIGSVSEKFFQARENYIEKNPDQIISKSKDLVGPELSEPLSKSDLRVLLDLKYLRSIIEPGEAVGIVAGQSIGEPSTQMTLNTFHLAGHATKNVTLGIPRLREIVMTASANIATPTMTLTLKPTISEDQAKDFAKRSSRLVLAELIDGVTVTEKASDHSKTYEVRLDFFPAEDYREEYSITKQEVHRVLKNRFVKSLEGAIGKALDPKRAKSKENVGKDDAMPEIGESAGATEEQSAPRPGDRSDDESEDEESDEEGDGDATAEKNKARREQANGYEGPDEDEEEIVDRIGRAEDEGLGDSEHSDVDRSRSIRKTEIVNANNVTGFEFDKAGQWCEIKLEYPAESPKVLMLAIVEKVCHDCVIHQLPNIGSLMKVPSSELSKEESAAGVQKIAVEGVNFGAIWEQSETVDCNTIETNDIACMLRTYGVEAARNNIVKEMNAVFAGHGISVDTRHLNLIGDIMTRGGGYTPFNRQGLASSVSPMLKMSFETTCNFLQEAAIEGDFDDLTSPSARIVMGKISGVGTGSFDVLVAGL